MTDRRTSRARTPNYVRFILTGFVVGFAIGGGIALFSPNDPTKPMGYPGTGVSTGSSVGFMGIVAGALGALVAAVIAALIEKRALKRARHR